MSFPDHPERKFQTAICGLPGAKNLVGRTVLNHLLFVYCGARADASALTDKVKSCVSPATITFASIKQD